MIDLDATDLDMIKRGDMLGSRTGEKVFAALETLSAVALPDELPVWGYHVRRLTDEGAKFSQSLRFDQEQASPTNVVTPLVSGPEAHSTIAALRGKLDEALDTLGRIIMSLPPGTRADGALAGVKVLRQRAETAEAAENLGAHRALHRGLDAFDQFVAGFDVDASVLVGNRLGGVHGRREQTGG
mgnify:CR=1 FL=1